MEKTNPDLWFFYFQGLLGICGYLLFWLLSLRAMKLMDPAGLFLFGFVLNLGSSLTM